MGRQKVHGDRFKTYDSLYDVAPLLHHKQRSASAIELLRQLMAISETSLGADGQLARAYYKLSTIHADAPKTAESTEFKGATEEARARLRLSEKGTPLEEPEFAKLNPFMLW